MSDINEEQKRLYKRAEENDIKLLQEENKDLKYSNIYLSKTCDKYKILQDYKLRNEKAIEQLFELKDIIYKPETRNENIEIQRKISSIIINLKGSDKE